MQAPLVAAVQVIPGDQADLLLVILHLVVQLLVELGEGQGRRQRGGLPLSPPRLPPARAPRRTWGVPRVAVPTTTLWWLTVLSRSARSSWSMAVKGSHTAGAVADSGTWRGQTDPSVSLECSHPPLMVRRSSHHGMPSAPGWGGCVCVSSSPPSPGSTTPGTTPRQDLPQGTLSPSSHSHLDAKVAVSFAQHRIHILQDQVHCLLQQVVVQVKTQQLSSVCFLQAERGTFSQGTCPPGSCSEPPGQEPSSPCSC